MTAVLAALASIPARAHLLPRVLKSLRPQVDRLTVYLNGYHTAPRCVLDLADQHVLDSINGGAEKKLHWSSAHTGIYLSCDDDFSYCAGYVATMCAHVAHWGGRAIVTAHGRTYLGRARGWNDLAPGSLGIIHKLVPEGRWVNYGGSGVMAWDTRCISLPNTWPLRNLTDAQIAVWAQKNRIPLWLVPHKAHWLEPLAYLDPKGIYKSSQVEGHQRRTDLIRSISWQLHTLET
jgi:hypothetical protein